MLLETINYYTASKSEVFALFIDASKAFDRVSHEKLFSILLDRNVCPTILRLLLKMYCNSSMCVRWGEQYGENNMHRIMIYYLILKNLN